MHIDPELTNIFFERFGRICAGFYLQQPDGSYRPAYRALTVQDIREHLLGIKTVGFLSVSKDGYCGWICFDDDNKLARSEPGFLDLLEKALVEDGFHPIREGVRIMPDGKIKQGHLWILFDKPINASLARLWARTMLKSAGIADDAKNLELFPKQDSAGNLGNCVRGPLGKHAKDNGQRGKFRDAADDINAQLEYLSRLRLNDSGRIESIGKQELELEKARLRYKNNFEKRRILNDVEITALAMIEELDLKLTERADRFLARCPVCAAEGHDVSENNLHLAKDGTWFACWFEGCKAKHTGSMIFKKLLQLTGRMPP